MMIDVRGLAQRILDEFNIQVTRSPAESRFSVRLQRACDLFDIDMILDVGANCGQFGLQMRRAGYEGRIVSFEPLSDAHIRLSEAASGDEKWIVHPRCAIGDYDGIATVNVAANSVSSSILPMKDDHSEADASSAYITSEDVNIYCLDTVGVQYLGWKVSPLLKIDTQGFEWQVLDGAQNILPKIKGILVEVSFVELYEGQRLWKELIERIEAAGFTIWTIDPRFNDPHSGRTLQCDIGFFRSETQ